MLRVVLLFNLILCPCALTKRKHHKRADSADDLGGELITSLRNDANLDLSMDEEYEDLRAELLAYHTALSSLTGPKAETLPGELPPEIAAAVAAEPGNNVAEVETRRAMKTTPCWKLGGICVNYKLCIGHRSITEVPGCKNKLEVCCFTWNKFEVKDFVDKGIRNLALPWSQGREFGGKGPIKPGESIIPEDGVQPNSESDGSDMVVYDLSSIKKSKKPKKKLGKMQKSDKKNKIGRKENLPLVVVLKPNKK